MAATELFNQYAVPVGDGRYFMPFANTMSGMDFARRGTGFIGDGGQEAVPGSGQNDDPLRYQPTGKTYNSLQDYFDALDPASGFYVTGSHPDGTPIAPSDAQNALVSKNATRGTYQGQPGYFFDPSSVGEAHPATTSGGKPNDTGLDMILGILAGPLLSTFSIYGAAAGEAGSSAFEGSVPAAAETAGAGLETVGGSAGADSLVGDAAEDTVAQTAAEQAGSSVGEQVGSGATQGVGTQAGSTLGSGLETVGSAAAPAVGAGAGAAAATGGLTAAEIAQLTPAALAAYNAITRSGNSGNSTANNAASNAAQISNDQWNYYKTNYQPLESNLVAQAQAAGSPEEFARARGVANADVTGAFDTARKNTLSRMQSYGINPGSPAFQSTAASTDIAEGATKAGALTAADNNTRNLAYSKALDVVGLGKGIPAQSAASAASAANAATAASREKFAQNTDNLKNAGYGLNTVSNVAQKWFGTPTTNQNNTVGNPTTYGETYSTTDPAYGASGGKVSPRSIGYAEGGAVIDAERTGPDAYDATALKGVLQKRGLSDVNAHAESSKAALRHKGAITPHMRRFAVGGGVGRQGLEGPDASNMGELQGPGTETSDSIPATIDGQQPAALSTGEVVMNAAVPKLSGDEILAALNEAGLKKREQGIEPQPQIPPDSGMQAYRRGGRVSSYGLGA
jgi:hypothetical protein